jgi:hypothetical protein
VGRNGTTGSRGYGAMHRRLRDRYLAVVASGAPKCARCGKPIRPDEPWDLDHSDEDRRLYLGPSHARCSRGVRVRVEPQTPTRETHPDLHFRYGERGEIVGWNSREW